MADVKKKVSAKAILLAGLISENPVFVSLLGMCPTLATTKSVESALGMGLLVILTLIGSNVLISLLRKFIPAEVKIPCYIVIIATFVTIIKMLCQAFVPDLYSSLGVFISLIVVNCIILGRAESYASKNPVLPSIFDGLGMGLGFTIALSILGGFREIIGAGTILGINIPHWDGIGIFVMAPGAFFVLAALIATQNYIKMKHGQKPKDKICDGNCQGCAMATEHCKEDAKEEA